MKDKRTVFIFFLGYFNWDKTDEREIPYRRLSTEGEERARELKNQFAEYKVSFDLKLINTTQAAMQTARLIEENPALRAIKALDMGRNLATFAGELNGEPVGRYANLDHPPSDACLASAIESWIRNAKAEMIATIKQSDADTVLVVTEPILAYALALQFRKDEAVITAVPKHGTYVGAKVVI